MPTSMIEYLASLREHGHTPLQMGEATIGRTVYIAGLFHSPEREAPEGSRARAEGRPVPAEDRIAMLPCYRTDWVTRDSAGPTPALLPASYRHSSRTIYVEPSGQHWYISGYSANDEVFWFNDAAWMFEHPQYELPRPIKPVVFRWEGSWDAAMRQASPEVLARIEAQQ